MYLSSTGLSEWAVAFTGVFLFIGGGPGVLTALLMTSITDTVSSEERTFVFCRVTAVNLFCQLVGGPLSGVLVDVNKWLHIQIGFGLVLLSIPIAVMIPETAKASSRSSVYSHSELERTPCGKENSYEHESSPAGGMILTARRKLVKLVGFLASHGNIAVLLLGCTMCRYADYARTDLLLQFVTKKFSWSWAKVRLVMNTCANIEF